MFRNTVLQHLVAHRILFPTFTTSKGKSNYCLGVVVQQTQAPAIATELVAKCHTLLLQWTQNAYLPRELQIPQTAPSVFPLETADLCPENEFKYFSVGSPVVHGPEVRLRLKAS